MKSGKADVGEESLSLVRPGKCLREYWNAKATNLLKNRENYVTVIFEIHLPLLGNELMRVDLDWAYTTAGKQGRYTKCVKGMDLVKKLYMQN